MSKFTTLPDYVSAHMQEYYQTLGMNKHIPVFVLH